MERKTSVRHRHAILAAVASAVLAAWGGVAGADGDVRVTTADLFPGGPFGAGDGGVPDVLSQNEPSVAVSPANPDHIAIGMNDNRYIEVFPVAFAVHRWTSLAFSNDGGRTFTQQSLVPGFPNDDSPDGIASPIHGNWIAADSHLLFDADGSLYFGFIAANFEPSPMPVTPKPKARQIAVAKYKLVNDATGGRLVYDKTVSVFTGSQDLSAVPDFPDFAQDMQPGSPYRGRLYASWVLQDVLAGAREVALAFSDDRGETWTRIDTGTGVFTPPFFSRLAVGPGGMLFVSWIELDFDTGVSTLKVARSKDGGQTFQGFTAASYTEFTQFGGPGSFATFGAISVAADESGLYIAYQERNPQLTGGNVKIVRSKDFGHTWEPAVSPHTRRDGHQFMPELALNNGKFAVMWHDSRSEPAFAPGAPVSGACSNDGCTGLDVFYAEARVDAGGPLAFAPERRVSDESFNPNLSVNDGATAGFIGDYAGIAVSEAGDVHIAWADNRDVNPSANAAEDGDIFTSPPELINARSRDSNIYFERRRAE